uniref:Uncharacterized protein n=1 Tax=Anopheles atroparvus TaxID=41427 RepID=A0A182JHD0_ANOAO
MVTLCGEEASGIEPEDARYAGYDVDGSGDSCPGRGVLPTKLTVIGPITPPDSELVWGGSVSRFPPAVLVPGSEVTGLLLAGPSRADPFAASGTVSEEEPACFDAPSIVFVGELSGVGPMTMSEVSIWMLEECSLGTVLPPPPSPCQRVVGPYVSMTWSPTCTADGDDDSAGQIRSDVDKVEFFKV